MSTSHEPLADDLFAGFANIQPSAESSDRAIARTRQALTMSGSSSNNSENSELATRHARDAVTHRSRLRMLVRGLIAAGIAAAVLTAFWLRTPSSWARVQEALNSKPWIHLRAKLDEGKVHDNWISLPQQKSAFRVGPTARYIDVRGDLQFDYEESRGTVIRAPHRPIQSPESMFVLFGSLLQGKPPNVEEIQHSKVLETRSRKVVENGREWLDVEFMLQHIEADPAFRSTARLEFRVDSETKLPQTMTLTVLDGGPNFPADAQRRLVYEIDYPAEGPADIYALGIPRDAKLDDRVPSVDTGRVLKALATARRDFDPYFALVFMGSDKDGFREPPTVVIWRRGNQVRAELCTPMPSLPPYSQKPADMDDLTWWKQQLKHFQFIPSFVCDGRTSSYSEYDLPDEMGRQRLKAWRPLATIRKGETLNPIHISPISHLMPDNLAYPHVEIDSFTNLKVDQAQTPEMPRGALLTLSVSASVGEGAYLRERFWLDGDRGFVTTRHNADQLSITHEKAFAQQVAVENDHTLHDLRKTPKGFWYPTRVVRQTAKEPKEPGAAREFEPQTTTSFLLDFNTEMADSLFTKKERTAGF